MIARIWHGAVPATKGDVYLDRMRKVALPDYSRPQTLAYGLHDSPIGLAAGIVEKLRAWSDCDGEVERRFTKDEILTLVMIYWATGTINSGNRYYFEASHTGEPLDLTGARSVPAAIAISRKISAQRSGSGASGGSTFIDGRRCRAADIFPHTGNCWPRTLSRFSAHRTHENPRCPTPGEACKDVRVLTPSRLPTLRLSRRTQTNWKARCAAEYLRERHLPRNPDRKLDPAGPNAWSGVSTPAPGSRRR